MGKSTEEFIEHVRGLITSALCSGPFREHRRKALREMDLAFRSFFGSGHAHVHRIHRFAERLEALEDQLIEAKANVTPGFAEDVERATDQAEAALAQQMCTHVEALLTGIEQGWGADLGVRVRVETHEEMLDIAAEHVASAPMAAAIVAGAVLENHLRKLAAAHGLQLPEGRTQTGIARAAQALKGAGVLGKVNAQYVQAWGDLRGAAQHGGSDFDASKVPEMIDGIRKLIEARPA